VSATNLSEEEFSAIYQAIQTFLASQICRFLLSNSFHFIIHFFIKKFLDPVEFVNTLIGIEFIVKK
jgi:hypothetical protein